MTASHQHQSKSYWDQSEFEQFKATWLPMRVAEEKKIFADIFALRKESRLLEEALTWAEQNGMQFFIDRKMTNARGVYLRGTGVLAINARLAGNRFEMVSTLVHEIRHAWQERHGFGGSDSLFFADHYIAQAIREADAKCIGLRAQEECDATLERAQGKPISPLREKLLADENADLCKKFILWFSHHAHFYGDKGSREFGQFYGVYAADEPGKGLINIPHEFLPRRRTKERGRINIDNVQDIIPLGASFNGTRNYLASMQPDQLPKYVLRPSMADQFWEAASDDQKKLTLELRKAALRYKRDHKQPRHPWP